MNSIRHAILVSLMIACLFLIACEDEDSFDLEFMNVSISADLMPPVPPGSGSVWCQIDVVLTNNSIKAFTELNIPFAELIVSNTGESLGKIGLHTDWPGNLWPGGQERFTLLKTDSPSQLSRIPCNEKIYLRVSLIHIDRFLKSYVTNDVKFGCVY